MDLEDFKYGGTNITSFRLVDPLNPEVQEVVKSWTKGEKHFPSGTDPTIPYIKVRRQFNLKLLYYVKVF